MQETEEKTREARRTVSLHDLALSGACWEARAWLADEFCHPPGTEASPGARIPVGQAVVRLWEDDRLDWLGYASYVLAVDGERLGLTPEQVLEIRRLREMAFNDAIFLEDGLQRDANRAFLVNAILEVIGVSERVEAGE